ncbi:MAG: carboxylating nicotinate-nucleotide diphosphorylase [Caldilineaceae bacterium]|nr:carboxylating nicotinate-nucleotide diphosphorylase [Caldilineaceae bacterium]
MHNTPSSAHHPAHQSRGLTAIDWSSVLAEQVPILIQRALDEDSGDQGDVTTLATIPADLQQAGIMLAKAPGVVAGLSVARQSFLQVDPTVEFTPLVEEGAQVSPGTHIAKVTGPARALLTGERVALNFLQRMSGIATATSRYVAAVAGTKARILDTRKTAPGLRLLDKWAVVLGGGHNHRIGLYDMAMIKDNHIAAAGGITAAVERVRQRWGRQLPIEVEVGNLEQLREALALAVDQIMLDNMGLAEMSAAVKLVDGRVPLEASGNVSLETVAAIAATGVDYISVGKLTHSVEALDISFKL